MRNLTPTIYCPSFIGFKFLWRSEYPFFFYSLCFLKLSSTIGLQKFYPMCFTRSFIVLALCVIGGKHGSFFVHKYPVSQHYLMKKMPRWIDWVLLSKIYFLYTCRSGSGFCPTYQASPHCLDYCCFIVHLEIRYSKSFNFSLLFKNYFVYPRTFAFSFKCYNQLVSFFLLSSFYMQFGAQAHDPGKKSYTFFCLS